MPSIPSARVRTLLAASALCVCPAAQDPGHALAHALRPGDRFAFAIDVDTRIDLDDASQSSRLQFVLHFAAQVGKTTDGHADVACRLHRLEAEVASPAARARLDSADPRERTGPLRPLAALVDGVFHVHVDPLGAIARVDVPAPLQALAHERLGTGFDRLFAAWFVPLPPERVAVGATWRGRVPLADPRLGEAPMLVEHKLGSVEEGRATLTRTFDVAPPPKRPGVCFDVTQAHGDVVFDVAAGRVVAAETVVRARATRETGAAGTALLRVRAFAEAPPAAPPNPPAGVNDR